MNANAPAFDGAKSMPRIYSRAQWERGMAISTAASAVVAEHHGAELGVHGDIVFVFVSARLRGCEIFGSMLRVIEDSDRFYLGRYLSYLNHILCHHKS